MVRASWSAVSASLIFGSYSVSVVLVVAGLLGGKMASAAAGFRLGLRGCRVVSVTASVGIRRVMHVIVRVHARATLTAESRCDPPKVSEATTMIGAGHEHGS